MSEIILKAFRYQSKEDFNYDGVVDANTRSQAQYRLWQKDGIGEEFIPFSKCFTFNRARAHDIMSPCRNKVEDWLELSDAAEHIFREREVNFFRLYVLDCQELPLFEELVNFDFVRPTDPKVFTLTRKGEAFIKLLRPARRYEQVEALSYLEQLKASLAMTESDLYALDMFTLELYKDNPKLFSNIDPNTKVYIYSGQWGLYWRGQGSGYTSAMSEAGIYGFADAIDRTHHCGEEKHIRYEFVNKDDVINEKLSA